MSRNSTLVTSNAYGTEKSSTHSGMVEVATHGAARTVVSATVGASITNASKRRFMSSSL